MSDMSKVIVARSDQVNAGDLVGISRTVRVAAVNVQPGTEQPVSIKIDGDSKVYRPCKSMSRVLVAAWGADSAKYAGRSMTLYNDPDVLWAGMKVGGIRISHMSHIDGPITLALAENKKNRKLFTVKPLATAKPSPAAATPQVAAADTSLIDAGQSVMAASNETIADPAADYAASIMDKISAAETVDEIEMIAEQARKKLARRPELLAGIETAAGFKVAFLNGGDAASSE